jgi:hypothetical protein
MLDKRVGKQRLRLGRLDRRKALKKLVEKDLKRAQIQQSAIFIYDDFQVSTDV